MMHRGLARIAVAAGAVLVGAAIAGSPAAAQNNPLPSPVPFPHAILELPGDNPLLAKDFDGTKGCDDIPGGAKTGTDGWVFDQPVEGAEQFVYLFALVDEKQKDEKKKPVVLGLDESGAIVNFDVSGFLPDGPSLKAGKIEKKAQSLMKAAGRADKGLVKAAGSLEEAGPLLPPKLALPEGVAGGLTDKGGVWLQTPAGWNLAYGLMIHDQVDTELIKFHLVRVCGPKAEPAATPTATPTPKTTVAPTKAPGAGGGSASLPVTGTSVGVLTGVGVLLIGVGALLFVMRRRRDTPKFVA